MDYFSLYDSDGLHCGFLIMIADDESAERPASGQFVFKLQDGAVQAAAVVLQDLQEPRTDQVWHAEKERVNLFAGGKLIAGIRQEYLNIGGQTFVLNDMTGML
ncbi:MAG: hypothetical protein Q4A49_04385 [Neisseria sp.]|nr:hypothetical protein [Neisseria sp.]